jgi:hypothetical protein
VDRRFIRWGSNISKDIKKSINKKMEKRIWHTKQTTRTQKVAQTELSEKIVNALSNFIQRQFATSLFMTD